MGVHDNWYEGLAHPIPTSILPLKGRMENALREITQVGSFNT